MSGSNTPSSNRSHSDQDVSAYMHEQTEHYCDIMKSFKVADLDALLAAKGKPSRGTKADKAMAAAWCYTPAEIREAKRARRMAGLPAIISNGREQGQTSITEFFQQG